MYATVSVKSSVSTELDLINLHFSLYQCPPTVLYMDMYPRNMMRLHTMTTFSVMFKVEC